MSSLEAATFQLQQASRRALQTTLFDSDKLVVTGGSFTQVVTTYNNSSLGLFPGLDLLRSVISTNAMHDARARFPRPRCWPNTYVDVKDIILEWSNTLEQPAILCFTGESESGKSAIAHEVAEVLSRRGALAGSFFFDKSRNQDDGNFFLTLAYQIAVNIPCMDKLVNSAVVRDPTILEMQGEKQLAKLILEPLFCLPTPELPFVVVVNGLDRCNQSPAQMEIIRLLARMSLLFGDTIRFLVFARQGALDFALDGNDFYWVGRHIPLQQNISTTSSLRLSHLGKYFFKPFRTAPASINDMWEYSYMHQSDRRHSINSGASTGDQSPKPAKVRKRNDASIRSSSQYIVASEFIAPGINSMGSPMSIDLWHRSPYGMAGSPMLIDSIRSSPVYGGSPMVIDSIYVSSSLAFSSPSGIRFVVGSEAAHLRYAERTIDSSHHPHRPGR